MCAKKNYHGIFSAARIKQLRQTMGLTQKAFADSLGIVQGYLSGIESGRKIPSHTLLMALCHRHGIREEWLFSGNGDMFEAPVRQSSAGTVGGKGRTPLLKSIPPSLPGNLREDEVLGHITLPDIPEGCFAITAEGDFMAPTIRNGDLVIFRPGRAVTNRSIVLLSNRWGEVILRRARITGREMFFSAENTSYAPFHPDADTKIYGTVVAVWRNIKTF